MHLKTNLSTKVQYHAYCHKIPNANQSYLLKPRLVNILRGTSLNRQLIGEAFCV